MNRDIPQPIDDRTLTNNAANVLWHFLQWLFRPHPSLRDELARRRSQMLAGMIFVTMAVGVVGLTQQIIRRPASLTEIDTWLIGGGVLIAVGIFSINRSGRVDLAARGFILTLGIVSVFVPFLPDAAFEQVYFAIVPILLTAIFFSAQATMQVTLSIIIAVTLLNLSTRPGQLLLPTYYLVITGAIVVLFIKHLQFQEGLRTRALEAINQRLRASEENLEQRVRERTRDLQVAADVSLQITTVLDRARLLADVAERTAGAFALYHVSIFLYDGQGILRLYQGVGGVGEQMIALDKQFQLSDVGLVPQAARTLQAALSNDVEQDSRHLPNPLLPETRSELAIPMVYQGKLIGVLDLQAKEVNRFRNEDSRILKTLADQIAVAVRNSQLFEEARVALEQAERANSVKSAFLASMSHELRTPLNAIINFTKFVAKGSMGAVNTEQRDTLNEVIDSAKHLLNLINDVLDMSKIEAGSLKLFVEPGVDLGAILKTIEATGKTLLAGKPVELQMTIEAGLPSIMGDRQRILQILLNILSNACKFTQEGTISIRAYRVNGDVIFAVADTGPGIDPEDQPLVFKAFKQTSTGLRQGGGTGLGMPISKSLAAAHGGRLWLDSEPGKGSVFYVALPIKSESLEPSIQA